ncbi:MAG TPA: Sec-independent protein translocase protein TatB [Candidatus Acidoferrum sp.]|nr:Sec-independent protein translocase protein TatB [Candidatus Acidoferrum sp.]
MFDIGWSEMLIIGVVALVVIGPKELPGALKTFAYWTKQARKLAREFQSGVDEMIRQAELDEAKQAVEEARRKIARDVEESVDPTGEVKQALTDIKETNAPTQTIAAPAKPATNGGIPSDAAGDRPAGEGTPASSPVAASAGPEKSA